MSLKFRYEHRLADYYALLEAAQAHELSGGQRWLLSVVAGLPTAVCILAGGLIAMAQQADASTTTSYCLGGAVFGYIVGGMVSRPVAMRIISSRPSLRAAEGLPAEIEFGDDALVQLGGGITETTPYTAIRFVLETEAGFFIACGNGAATIPAVAFRSAEDLAAARKWLRTHLPAEARSHSLLRAG
jgi:hypothetical protein